MLVFFGTGFYGCHDGKSDGSFIATEWLHFFGIPLIPLGTARVRYLKGTRTRYQNLEELPLDVRHVGRTYLLLLVVSIVAWDGWIFLKKPVRSYTIVNV